MYTLVKQLVTLPDEHVQYTQIADVHDEHNEHELPPDVEEQLTEYEKYVIERNAEHDARIDRLKEELANQQPPEVRKGTPALELHPDVKNIPHGDVRVTHDLLPTEVAE
jgi:hypothetical protein